MSILLHHLFKFAEQHIFCCWNYCLIGNATHTFPHPSLPPSAYFIPRLPRPPPPLQLVTHLPPPHHNLSFHPLNHPPTPLSPLPPVDTTLSVCLTSSLKLCWEVVDLPHYKGHRIYLRHQQLSTPCTLYLLHTRYLHATTVCCMLMQKQQIRQCMYCVTSLLFKF